MGVGGIGEFMFYLEGVLLFFLVIRWYLGIRISMNIFFNVLRKLEICILFEIFSF